MKILFIGDIFGKAGRRAVSHQLPLWQKEFAPDCVIANVENATHGIGAFKEHAEDFKRLGIHIMTGGNHSIENPRAIETLTDETLNAIRPANAPKGVPGKGVAAVLCGGERVTAINLLGQFGMRPVFNSAFDEAEELLARVSLKESCIIVDWHAEATSEKVALGYFLDGRVTAVIGTHTHIPTRDEKILPKGTAYITDVGMTGPTHSVIGKKVEPAIRRLATQIPEMVDVEEEGSAVVNAVLIEADTKTHLATSIKPLEAIVQ